MKRYHPKTQKALNEFARKFLTLYRNHRVYGKDTPKIARWRAWYVLSISLSGNVYYIASARYEKVRKTIYKTL